MSEQNQWKTNFGAGTASPGDAIPILKKAEIDSLHIPAGSFAKASSQPVPTVTEIQGTGLPKTAIPVANDKDERLSTRRGQR